MTTSLNLGAGRSRGHDHYDPNQPRVPAGDPSGHGGRWTVAGGVSLASAAMAAAGARTVAPFAPNWIPVLRELLRGAPAGALAFGPLAFLRALLVSAPAGVVAEAALPNQPGVRYRYDEGFLTLYLRTEDGQWPLIFHGRAGEDGLFRLAGGAVIGRDLGTGVLLNESAIDQEEERKRDIAQAGAVARSKDQEKICPDSTPERGTRDQGTIEEMMLVRWRQYQHQITGVEYGYSVVLNDVEFDGCRTTDRAMLEAKGPGFENMLKDRNFDAWFSKKADIINQMQRQCAAAPDRRIEWHVAEAPMAAYVAGLARQAACPNLVVLHTPFIEPAGSP